MSYSPLESSTTLADTLKDIDNLVHNTVAAFKPTDEYAVRDLIINDTGVPVLIERDEATPLNADIRYREVRNRERLLVPEPQSPQPLYLGLTRWFDTSLEIDYAACVTAQEPGPKRYERVLCETNSIKHIFNPLFVKLFELGIETGDCSFFVPQKPTSREQDYFDSNYREYICSAAYYRLYRGGWGSEALAMTTPDFREIYAHKHDELVAAVVAYAYNPQNYIFECGINVDDPTEDEELHLYEIKRILSMLTPETTVDQAVQKYGVKEGIMLSSEHQSEEKLNVHELIVWIKARKILRQFIDTIVPSS